MSNSFIPCRAPYVPARIEPNAKKVTIKVGQGDDMHVYFVPIVFLCRVSDYFRDHLHDADRAMRHRGLAFAHGSSELWEVFVDFVHSGTLNHCALRSIDWDEFYPFFLSLYSFASSLQAYAFRNAIIDTLFLRIAARPDRLPYEHVRDIYTQTSEDAGLENLVIAAVVNVERAAHVEKYKKTLPRAFLVDCLRVANENGVVPFSHDTNEDRRAWLRDEKREVCEEYHVHDEDEDMDDGDEYGDDSDDGWEEHRSEGPGETAKRELAFIGDLAKNPRYARY